jgi:DNA (cytosine-5)-methyltransferase 1
MRYLSVCSGIEAASVAWHPLGWQAAAFAEIEDFPSAVLAHRFPNVPNWGDITRFREWPDAKIDVLVGGTPCQSFSVAGLRSGLADPRGHLALTYLGIADRYRPRIVVWENFPGVLSSNGGRDFGAFLGALVQLGYGVAYRVLDAQYVRAHGFGRAVPQRRRRVIVVGHTGGWERAAQVLFDRASLSRDPPPRRSPAQETAGTIAASAGRRRGVNEGERGSLVVQPYPVANCLTQRMHKGINTTLDEGQTPIVTAFSCKDYGADASRGVSPTLRAMGHTDSHANAGGAVGGSLRPARPRRRRHA